MPQVSVVPCAIRQSNVEVPRLFARRKIGQRVHREREHGVIAGEDTGRAVALVNVQVDDRHAQGPSLPRSIGLHHPRRHRDVVENAIAGAGGAVRVVSAAGEVDGHARVKGSPASSDRGADRAARTLDQRRAPGKTDRAHFGRAQPALEHAGDVVGLMHERELAFARGRRFGQLYRRILGGHPLPQAGVLAHWERVARR
jgi:hypothetical protein